MAIGDFNDVAWSHTSQLFKRIGDYLDARIRRGTYATFPASAPFLGWPLNHLFVTPDFTLRSIEVLEDVGSDYHPNRSEICLAERVGLNAELASREDRRDMHDIFNEYQDDRPAGDGRAKIEFLASARVASALAARQNRVSGCASST